jgi:hypothetical protein
MEVGADLLSSKSHFDAVDGLALPRRPGGAEHPEIQLPAPKSILRGAVAQRGDPEKLMELALG